MSTGLMEVQPNVTKMTSHPCFNKEAARKHGRMHVPVAPRCNISCNYCNRKYDCMNESRPGVTSEVIKPDVALERIAEVRKVMPYVNTIGVAGPGDSLANPDKTFAILDGVRQKYNDMHLCLSTNGLMLPDYAAQIAEYNISHLTVTMNAVNPKTAAQIYRQVRFDGNVYSGEEGARILLERQQEGIAKLKEHNVMVKINFIYIPDINGPEVAQVMERTSELGATLFNIMPLIPVKGTKFENHPGSTKQQIAELRVKLRPHLTKGMRYMSHCSQCRSDAIGLLKEAHTHQMFQEDGTIAHESCSTHSEEQSA